MPTRDIIECSHNPSGYRVLVAIALLHLLLSSAIVCFVQHTCVLSRYTVQTGETTTETTMQITTQNLDVNRRESVPSLLKNQWSIDKIEPYCRFVTKCKSITCSHIPKQLDPGEVTNTFIEEIFKVECDSNVITELILEKSTFPGNELREKWLKTDVAIEKLTFRDCSLIALSDDAFSSAIYGTMKKLVLSNNNISTLRRATFRHLPSLRDLSIQRSEIKQAEGNLLKDVAGTLQSLQLEENAIANVKVLRNITGGSVLPKVQQLSLRYNRIPIIDSLLLSGVPNVESLYLSNSQVSTVDTGAFESISGSVRQIFMSGNDLATLPEGLFDTIIRWNPHFRLTIDNNPWRCDCSLKWMQNMTRDYPDIIKNDPICKSPKENANKTFTDASFCGETIANKTIRVNCNIVVNLDSSHSNRTRAAFSRSDLEITLRFRNFFAEARKDGTVLVTLPDSRNVSLIWFANDARRSVASLNESIRCVGEVRGSYLLQDLQPRKSYTICSYDDSDFSPLNCMGVSAFEPWLTSAIIIAVFVVSLILTCLASAVVMLVAVRRHPTMLRGSKRIVIVKRKALDAVVLPKGLGSSDRTVADRRAIPAISRNFKEDGYVTPLPPLLRTSSTRKGSARSSARSVRSVRSDGTGSYISSIEPTRSQLNLWRLAGSDLGYTNCETEPPPLPPHPQRNAAQPSSTALVSSTGFDEDGFVDLTWAV